MKIVFLHDNPPDQGFAGATISTYDLARGVAKLGHQVSVITTCREVREAGESDYHGLKVFKIASNYPGRWRAYLSLYNPSVVKQVEILLKKIKPDVVHAHNIHFYLSYHCLKIAKKYAKTVIFTARDVMPFNFGKLQTQAFLEHGDYRTNWRDHWRQVGKRWNPLRNSFIKHYLAYADKIVAVSDALKTALEQNGIGNVVVIHTGADLDQSPVVANSVSEFRESHKIQDWPIIFFGGRLSTSKGSKQTLLALAKIKDKTNAMLVVAAKLDSGAEAIRHQAEQLGIGDRVVFTGWLSATEMKTALASADVVLVPSICFDSFPRVVLEAMAAGKPVIGTCYGGASEVIVDNVTGYVVNPFDVQDLSGKLLDLLVDSEKAKLFGRAGSARIRENFNLVDKVTEYLALYKQFSLR